MYMIPICFHQGRSSRECAGKVMSSVELLCTSEAVSLQTARQQNNKKDNMMKVERTAVTSKEIIAIQYAQMATQRQNWAIHFNISE